MSPTGFLRAGTSNVAEAEVIDATTGAGFAGAVTVYVSIDGGTPVLGTVGGGAAIAQGSGWFKYLASAAESDGVKCSFQFRGTGAVSALSQYYTITTAQAQALASATGPGVRYVQTIIKNALMALAVYSPRDPLKPDDAQYCLSQLNQILDDWNADIQANYAELFLLFSSTGANPETIGPSGTWTQNARPVSIEGVAFDDGSGQYQPVYTTNDPAWWAARASLPVGAISGTYYEPSEPNGKLYFYGLPSAGTTIRLMLRTTFGPVALTDAMNLPQGYESALTLTLQEAIADTFHAMVTPQMSQRAGKARARIFSNNLRVPTLRAPMGTPGLCPPTIRPATVSSGSGGWMQSGWTQ